ncbi:tail fiber protein [Proteus vulgaris]|uniref:tail fiber protein n=2 Tax=Morganellaceae TaxID=1903414 RepID=UPI00358DAC38
MALVGESYTTTQSDNKYQLKGDYADKSSRTPQYFNGGIVSSGDVGSRTDTFELFLKTDQKPSLLHKSEGIYYRSTLPQKSGTLALLSDIDEANNIPVGSPIPWSLGTAPSGYLICNGQTFNKSTYPKLAIAYPAGRLP